MWSPDEAAAARATRIWLVWYEDRFGWGPDRDPPSVVAVYLREDEARAHVEADGGAPDVSSGKFDGLFVQDWTLHAALESGLVSEERARELLAAAPG